MKPSDYKISLDILEGQSQYALPMKKGDTSRVIYITLREGAAPYEIGADCFAVFSGKKPDGTVLENNCVISGNTIIYAITPQTSAASGLVDCEIKLYGADSALVTSARFSIIVDERAVGEEQVESTSEFTALTNLYSDINTKMLNGDFKGDKGDKGDTGAQGPQGIQGEKGEKGDMPAIDQTYDSTSENAQSGVAVAEGISKFESEVIGDVDSALDSIIEMQESLIDGTATPDGTDDENGSSSDGTNGESGTSVTISSIVESSKDGGSNVVTFSDGNTLTIKNGNKGSQGEKGDTGEAGADGYTPVKGTDYFTEADKEEFKADLDIFTDVSSDSTSANLCDNEWEYGYLSSDGTNNDTYTPITVSFRSVNYIEVNGGEFLCQNNNGSYTIKIVQYDENKELVVALTDVNPEINRWTENGITLNENTKYIRIACYKTVEDLSSFKLNLFYIADIDGMFADPGDVFLYVPRFSSSSAEYINAQKIQTPLTAKKIVYDGDSICIGTYGGGGYAKLIADKTNGYYENQAVGGGRLITAGTDGTFHSVVDNLENLSTDGDLYCFEGGINDYWTESVLGTYDYTNFDEALDETTVCGALETIFRYALNTFVGKSICFIITHKIQSTAYVENSNGDTFKDYRDAMIGICNKYSIPYYDAFTESGLNGWNTEQNNAFLTGNSEGTADGCHPNEEGYKRYYVPQLISLFEKIMVRE